MSRLAMNLSPDPAADAVAEHAQKIESACRHLCHIRGQDPDEAVGLRAPGDDYIGGNRSRTKRWKTYVNEVQAGLQVHEALRAAGLLER